MLQTRQVLWAEDTDATLLRKVVETTWGFGGKRSRLVTKIRWVVESVNSSLKRHWRFLDGRIENTYLPNLGMFVKVCCALVNAFAPPLASDTPETAAILEKMLNRSKQKNQLEEDYATGIIPKHQKKSSWTLVSDGSLDDFPLLCDADLRDITVGVYQIGLSASYVAEHMNEQNYDLYVLKSDHHLKLIR